jgi:maleylpyruvate isomerase
VAHSSRKRRIRNYAQRAGLTYQQALNLGRAAIESRPDQLTTNSWELIAQVDDVAALLLDTAAVLTDEQIRQPSLLEGWTRGHVLTHVARGGDALRNLLYGARTGTQRDAYASQEARNADIEAGSGRTAAALVADLRESAAAWRATVESMPEHAWTVQVGVPGIKPFPASQLVIRRLVEIELHHVDLDAGYLPRDWPTTFRELALTEPMRVQRADRLV